MGERNEMFDSIKLFRGLVVATWMLLLIGFFRCECPFSTRTPVEPEKPRPYNLQSRTSPENVLSNFKIVYEYALSVVDYMDGLTEDFHFSPDPLDSLKYEDTFSNPWNLAREEQFTTNLFDRVVSDPNPRALSHWEFIVDVVEVHEAYFEYEYELGFNDEQDGAWKSAEGKAHLYLRKGEDGNWALSRWVDEKTNAEIPSWGALRAQF
jgi:hypothetical protein